ncbi:hypothetical protein BS17DRAFT_795212 [Gyrodon lividus]|nr:hypothetical protein BS17DRAFT_795212 [Gyrodon lividus]
MASLCRLIAPRRVASASFSRSAVLSAATISAEQSEELSIPKIFDIFDAPVKLRESSKSFGSSEAAIRASTARVAVKANSSSSINIYSEALQSPWTLPPPVTFDGPACPPHLSPSALEKRRILRKHLAHSSRISSGTSSVSFTALALQSEPLYEVFDGPSRINRYKYPSSPNEGSSYTYVCLVLCISSAFGWLASGDMLDSHRQSDAGST